MSTCEVMLTALVAAFFFANNLRLARHSLSESGLVPYMLSESRFNRRLHKIKAAQWQEVLTLLAQRYPQDTFLIDSYPVPAGHNRRAYRCRLYQDDGNAYWGYCAAKEEYYYGLKAHVIVTQSGRPVEVLLLCVCSGDLTGMKELTLDLPAGAQLYADKAYTDYTYEESLLKEKQLTFSPYAGALRPLSSCSSRYALARAAL